MTKQSPCWKCPVHNATCHGPCKIYRDWAAENRQKKQAYNARLPDRDMEYDLYYRGRQTDKGVLERRPTK